MARVLIVEDDGALRQDMLDNVADWGHDVRGANTGRDGFRVITDWYPDIVLSDVNMPDGSGFELMRLIRECGAQLSDIGFIFISSQAAPSMIIKGLSIGADDYLAKPIDYGVLRAKIGANIRRQETQDLALSSLSHGAATIRGVLFAAAFAGGVLAFGIVVIMMVYWFKTVLGINIFEDVHFSDLWS